MIHEMITRLNRVGSTSGFATFGNIMGFPMVSILVLTGKLCQMSITKYVFSMYFVSLIRFMRMASINMLKSIPMRNTDN